MGNDGGGAILQIISPSARIEEGAEVRLFYFRAGRARRSSRFVAQLASGDESRQQRRSGSLSMDRVAPSQRVRAAILVWRQRLRIPYAATRICLPRN